MATKRSLSHRRLANAIAYIRAGDNDRADEASTNHLLLAAIDITNVLKDRGPDGERALRRLAHRITSLEESQ